MLDGGQSRESLCWIGTCRQGRRNDLMGRKRPTARSLETSMDATMNDRERVMAMTLSALLVEHDAEARRIEAERPHTLYGVMIGLIRKRVVRLGGLCPDLSVLVMSRIAEGRLATRSPSPGSILGLRHRELGRRDDRGPEGPDLHESPVPRSPKPSSGSGTRRSN